MLVLKKHLLKFIIVKEFHCLLTCFYPENPPSNPQAYKFANKMKQLIDKVKIAMHDAQQA